MEDLQKRKIDLENKINAFEYPLRYSQVIQKETLQKELNRIKTQRFILKMKGQTNE